MRIRSTKPEFWRSSRVASVSWDARLVLKGLESYIDDNGVGRHDLALIVGDLFQRDLIREPSRTLARVSEAISELSEAGLLWLYSHEGTDLLYLSFWDSIQRVDKPQDGRFPRPDGTLNYRDSEIREPLATPREPSRTFAPVTGEQGNRGTEEQRQKKTSSPAVRGETVDALDEEFDRFWRVYPRKVGKAAAKKAYRAARRKVDIAAVRDALRTSHAAWESSRRPLDRIPHPATWLNSEPWHDDPDAIAPVSPITDRRQQATDQTFDQALAWAHEQDQHRQEITG